LRNEVLALQHQLSILLKILSKSIGAPTVPYLLKQLTNIRRQIDEKLKDKQGKLLTASED
jgi:hypothetical protein